jgi:hypothetical protein
VFAVLYRICYLTLHKNALRDVMNLSFRSAFMLKSFLTKMKVIVCTKLRLLRHFTFTESLSYQHRLYFLKDISYLGLPQLVQLLAWMYLCGLALYL